MIRAVLFDLDGVLIDATEWHYEALNRALALFSYTITRREHVTIYNGLPTKQKLELLSATTGFPRVLHRPVWRLKQRYTEEEILRCCRPNFEKELMMHRLRRDGYRLAVCSNSIRSSVELMLRGAALDEVVEFFVSNEDVGRPKPEPDMYVAALERLGLAADEAIAVEDAGHGVAAARAAGLRVCEVGGFDDVNYERIREFLGTLNESAPC